MTIRLVAVVLTCMLLAAPALARPRGECVRLTKQMARYERDAGWARDRGDQRWEQASLDQRDRLEARRNKLCPEMAGPNPIYELYKFGQFLGKAARLAASYFTSGF